MSDLSTALRAFLTRRLDPTTVYSYALLFGLVAAVVVTGAMIVTNQLRGL
jgi:Flp pilus assembly pilin Flp